MAKNLTITGKGAADELKRYNALSALQKAADTDELVKLQKAIKDPNLRGYLKMI